MRIAGRATGVRMGLDFGYETCKQCSAVVSVLTS
jgi:hypothetical protein